MIERKRLRAALREIASRASSEDAYVILEAVDQLEAYEKHIAELQSELDDNRAQAWWAANSSKFTV